MLDFVNIKEKLNKGTVEIYPSYKVKRTKDLMVKGKTFYAIWDDDKQMWSTDEYDVPRLIDKQLYDYKNSKYGEAPGYHVLELSDFNTKMWTEFQQYVKSRSDSLVQLDSKVIFANTPTTREDYSSKRLSYSLEDGDISAYDELMSTLYSDKEREKIEWAIGSIISGDSKKIQKFLVLYGQAGAGKSTVLNIIQMIFDGYYCSFDAKGLTSNSDAFSTEAFKNNPLVAIQHDGDLSRIEDNSKLNSIVSHEKIIINEKFKSKYEMRSNAFLFMATNKPVKITDSKSGIIRRLIDVSPTGEKVPTSRYNKLIKEVKFELGAIAKHCLDLYLSLGSDYYNSYVPLRMMYNTDIFFNFVEEYYDIFKKKNWVNLKEAYGLYKVYCDETLIPTKLPMYKFREELKDYFDDYSEMTRIDGMQVRSVYSGFRDYKFEQKPAKVVKNDISTSWINLDKTTSLFDSMMCDCPAQYASRNEMPITKWSEVETQLKDLNTKRLHYVKVPENMIVIDFDLKDENGEKSMELNLEAANKWPPTYAEFSKSEAGIHLHYIYTGDPGDLNHLYSEGIEVKVFKGNASLRRKLSKCNDIPIKEISSGLPLKGAKKTMDFEALKNEKAIRKLIANNLLKKYHPATKPSIDFIHKILEDAYNSGIKYDVSNMYNDILTFAMNSTNNAEYCMKKVSEMHFISADEPDSIRDDDLELKDMPIIFYDVEVYPNLFVVCWKKKNGEKNHKVHSMINPSPVDISNFVNSGRLVGFNCRRYDNHILYGRMIGYTNEQLYDLSQKIINGNKNNPAFFREAYNISYTDIYDFADASHKQSLKKFEIELGIHHQEMSIPWNEPVPENMWDKVVEYCSNDVIATEATFDYLEADWVARQILSELSGLNVNSTTNQHTTRIIFGLDVKTNPELVKSELKYTDLSEMFPGYSFENGKSTYRGEETGEGGYVYAEPGMYTNVALLDIASMHPTSIEELNLFGKYTKNFSDLKKARIYIKHKEFDKAKKLFNGKLAPYLDDEKKAKELSMALKTAINSVYGLTSARFDNPFRDPRNLDNIVAKRGALFMIDLKHEVQARGFTVAHIKTDSIKIPNATPDIIKFVTDFGKKYGYTFEHEATYEKMCLVNNAVYIAKDKSDHHWTATGAQFAQPYVFKTLFSHEPLIFSDVCETKSVKDALYLDMNEDLGPDEHNYKFVGKVGLFCPVVSGIGGGELVVKRQSINPIYKNTTCDANNLPDDYYIYVYPSATGAKGYRWLEAEVVKNIAVNGTTVDSNIIDLSYYDNLVNDAYDAIDIYGDAEWFMSDDPVEDEKPLPWYPPCGDEKIDICGECSKYNQETKTCSEGYNLNGYIIERSKKHGKSK